MRAITHLSILLALGVQGCGAVEDSTPSIRHEVADIGCSPKRLTLTGDVEGTPIDESFEINSRSFQQLASPYSFDVEFGRGGALSLKWGRASVAGDPAPVTGSLQLASSSTLAGQKLCVGGGSFMEPRQRDVRFVFDGLSRGVLCPATPIAGRLVGCAAGFDD